MKIQWTGVGESGMMHYGRHGWKWENETQGEKETHYVLKTKTKDILHWNIH